jgi:hypothetical protein
MLVTYTPTGGGTAIDLAGVASDCSDDPQGFALAYRDADSVEDIVGAAYPSTFRRGNRAVSASFRTTWLYSTIDAAQTAALGLMDEFTLTGVVTFKDNGGTTRLTLTGSLVAASVETVQGCTVVYAYSITGYIA